MTASQKLPTRHSLFQNSQARLKKALTRFPLHIVIIGIGLLWMTPAFGLLTSSFRDSAAVASSGWWTAFQPPFEFTLENYQDVLTRNRMWPSFINSLIISIPGTVIPILVAAYAAFAFAWMKFPGRDALFILVVALLVVPVQMTLIPVLRLLTNLQMAGSFPAIWLAHTAYGLPFAIFLLRNFFGALPRELLESAYLDGASNFQVFFRLILPLSVPALASLAIFQFLWVWNDLLVALVILQDPAKAPMTVTITNLVSSLRNSVAVADLGRLHLHDTPPGPFLRPAALLRAGYTDRSGEGLVS